MVRAPAPLRLTALPTLKAWVSMVPPPEDRETVPEGKPLNSELWLPVRRNRPPLKVKVAARSPPLRTCPASRIPPLNVIRAGKVIPPVIEPVLRSDVVTRGPEMFRLPSATYPTTIEPPFVHVPPDTFTDPRPICALDEGSLPPVPRFSAAWLMIEPATLSAASG